MAMPKTTMDKNGPASSDKSDVRSPGEILPMEAIAREARYAQNPADSELGSGIFAANRPHVGAASRWSNLVHIWLPTPRGPHALEQRDLARN